MEAPISVVSDAQTSDSRTSDLQTSGSQTSDSHTSDSQTSDTIRIEPGFFAAQRAEANKGGAVDDPVGHGLETNAMNAVTDLQPEHRTPTGGLSGSRATGIMEVPNFEPLPIQVETAAPTPQNAIQDQTGSNHNQPDEVATQDGQGQPSESAITFIVEPPSPSLNAGATGLEPQPEWMSFQFSDVSTPPPREEVPTVRQQADWNEVFLQPDEQPFVTGYETVAMQAHTEPIADIGTSSDPPPTGEFVAPSLPPHLANPELEKWDSRVRSFAETHVSEQPAQAPPAPVTPQPQIPHPPPAYDYRPRPDRVPAHPPQMMMQPPAPARRSGLGFIVLGVILVIILVGALLVWRFALSDVISKRTEKPVVTEEQTGTETPAPPPPVTSASAAPEGMVYVEGGMYEIGRDDGDQYAQPRRAITLAPFYIDRTEVTNAEYKRFVDERLHAVPEGWVDGHYPAGMDNVPVVNVSWHDAADFARWAGKRLPTETEWEAAARGKDGRIYPWGNTWRDSAANTGSQGVVEVGRYKVGASPCGALDMIGNVWEWTSDEFHLYPGNKNPMPVLKSGITYRIFRGGAYDSQSVDSSYRGFHDANKGYPKVGFRCVKNADQ